MSEWNYWGERDKERAEKPLSTPPDPAPYAEGDYNRERLEIMASKVATLIECYELAHWE